MMLMIMIMMNTKKNGSIRGLLKGFDRDYYKPIRTDYVFGGENNSYIEYTSRGDRYVKIYCRKNILI